MVLNGGQVKTGQPTRQARLAPLGVVALTGVSWCVLLSCLFGVIGHLWSGATYLKNYRGPTSAEMRISMAMDYAESSTEQNDVLLVGDATCESISTLDLEKATGIRAWNLCALGLVESDGIAELLRRYLEHHPAPRLLVIVRHPFFLKGPQVARSPGLARSRYDFLRHFEPGSSEKPLPASQEFRANVKEGWWDLVGLASAEFGRPMNTLVDDCGGVTPVTPDTSYRCPGVPLSEVRSGYARTHGAEGGGLNVYAQAAWLTPSIVGRETDGRILGALNPDPHAIADMEKILHQATDRRIPTLLRLSPVMNEVGAQVDAIEAWLQDLAARNPGITIAQPPVPQYDRSLFQDLLHTNAPGTARFNAQVIEDVRAILGNGARSGASVAHAGPTGN